MVYILLIANALSLVGLVALEDAIDKDDDELQLVKRIA